MSSTIDRQDSLFPKLQPDDIECMTPYGEEVRLAVGHVLFQEGAPASEFYVIIDGQVRVTKKFTDDDVLIITYEAGDFTGEITALIGGSPLLATGTATVETRALRIPIAAFRPLMDACPQVRDIVLTAMVRRGPEVLAIAQQREKMASLGILSAGLAHELNNPAAAAKRAAAQLRSAIELSVHLTLVLAQAGVMMTDCPFLRELRANCIRHALTPKPIGTIEKADREEALATWLDEHLIADGYELAPALFEAGVSMDEAEALTNHVDTPILADTMRWLAAEVTVSSLTAQIEKSADRMSELVAAVKNYAYADQGTAQEVDVLDGIENSVTILSYKIRHGNLKIVREFAADLPRITTYGGELNQVWTNLLDNAVDALDGKGTITIRACRRDDRVVVEVCDDGPGIPDSIKSRIFDPFFTTKPIGKGTGLGLDTCYRIVVQSHHGELRVESKPGDTRFIVSVPITQSG